MKPVRLLPCVPLCVALLALTGCASTGFGPSEAAADSASSARLLGQTQLPPGAKIRHDESLVMGAGDDWLGRLVLDVGSDGGAAYAFFLDSFPKQGWQLVSATRGRTSLLVFTRAERSATVEIGEASLGRGAAATLTVSPRGTAPAPAATPSGRASPAR